MNLLHKDIGHYSHCIVTVNVTAGGQRNSQVSVQIVRLPLTTVLTREFTCCLVTLTGE